MGSKRRSKFPAGRHRHQVATKKQIENRLGQSEFGQLQAERSRKAEHDQIVAQLETGVKI